MLVRIKRQADLLAINLEAEAASAHVILYIAGRGLDGHFLFFWILLDFHFEAQIRIFRKIVQTLKTSFLLGGKWTLPILGEKLIFSMTEIL